MTIETKEFLGSCDCCSADGVVETISSYRWTCGDDRDVFHRSKNMLVARWCDQAQAFFVAGQDVAYRPTEPLLLAS